MCSIEKDNINAEMAIVDGANSREDESVKTIRKEIK
jgi:hypothetical protein